MRTKAAKKAADCGSWAFATLTMGLVMLVASISPISRPKVHIDKCPLDSAGKVIPDRTADGVLTLAADIYFVHRDGVDDSIVASWRGKGGSNGPAAEMSGHVGELAHVQYCGRTVTRVTASGVNIFDSPPDTQATLDKKAASERRLSLRMSAG